jgi:hypothetical protein
MSHPNHQRRRNRTIRLEILESRTLLSAVGVPAHHVAEVAPLVRKDPKITGTLEGSLTKFSPGAGVIGTATFGCKGKLKDFSHKSLFLGSVEYLVTQNAKDVTYTSSGSQSLTDENNNADTILVNFTGHGEVTNKKESKATFEWNGSVSGGTGKYANMTGTFHAKGDLFGNTFKMKATLKVTIP